jgi:3'(2'), 5'-bisphosphate nucleotidase
MNPETGLVDAVRAAMAAGKAILEVYNTDFRVETKADQSPLTLADQKAHTIIKGALCHHEIPSISEEGRSIPYEERRHWQRMWVIDPLDGTKEFVKRNGEFTVNIALIEGKRPVMGVVYAPVPKCLYFASEASGACKLAKHALRNLSRDFRLDDLLDAAENLPIRKTGPLSGIYTIVGSRSHSTPELEAFVAEKRQEKGTVDFIQAGSSLKICLVAEGAADIYPRLGPTMEWDTAAGHAVAEWAGATVSVYRKSRPLIYNKPDLHNPSFIVERPDT